MKELADALEVITWGMGRGSLKLKPKVSSTALFITSVMLTLTGAYARNCLIKLTLIITAALVLTVVSNAGIRKNAVKTYLYVITFALFLGLPTLFISRNSNTLTSVLETALTTASATSPMIIFFTLKGLQGVTEVFDNVSQELKHMLNVFITLMPKISRVMSEVIIARTSRNLRTNTRNSWKTLTTSVGDTLIYLSSISQNISLAITSRNIGLSKKRVLKLKLNIIDCLTLLTATVITFLSLFYW